MGNYNIDLFKEKAEKQEFDKALWIQKKKEERDRAFGLVDAALERIKTVPGALREYLDIQARFRQYSVNNALLILAQKPDATILGDFDFWRNHGLYMLKGTKGMLLLERGSEYTRKDGTVGVNYNTKKVFDVSQCRGLYHEPGVPEHDPRMLLRALLCSSPCPVKVDEGNKYCGSNEAIYDSGTKTVYVARGFTAEKMFPAAAKELAHALLDKDGYDRFTFDPAASCAAYILCARAGMDASQIELDPAFTRMLGMTDAELRAELSTIRTVANDMDEGMQKLLGKDREDQIRADER